MDWILVFCTESWTLCGQVVKVTYPTEEQCYSAMNELYKRKGEDYFKWIICSPRSTDKE